MIDFHAEPQDRIHRMSVFILFIPSKKQPNKKRPVLRLVFGQN